MRIMRGMKHRDRHGDKESLYRFLSKRKGFPRNRYEWTLHRQFASSGDGKEGALGAESDSASNIIDLRHYRILKIDGSGSGDQ
jgi:hypothetical protein